MDKMDKNRTDRQVVGQMGHMRRTDWEKTRDGQTLTDRQYGAEMGWMYNDEMYGRIKSIIDAYMYRHKRHQTQDKRQERKVIEDERDGGLQLYRVDDEQSGSYRCI